MQSLEREEQLFAEREEHNTAESVEGFEVVEPEIERLREELAEERERGQRLLAEFDNYRRRTRQEQGRARQDGQRELLLSLLEVMDDFDRALEHVADTSDPVATGLRIIHQRFAQLLEANGVTAFESKGRHFDPARHDAVSVLETGEGESGTVFEEVSRGYVWGEELLRPARVIVVR